MLCKSKIGYVQAQQFMYVIRDETNLWVTVPVFATIHLDYTLHYILSHWHIIAFCRRIIRQCNTKHTRATRCSWPFWAIRSNFKAFLSTLIVSLGPSVSDRVVRLRSGSWQPDNPVNSQRCILSLSPLPSSHLERRCRCIHHSFVYLMQC